VSLRGSGSSCVCSTTSSRDGVTSGKLGDGDLADSTSAPDGGSYGGEERGTCTTGDSLRLTPRDPELETCVPLSLRVSSSGAGFRRLSGVDSASGRKSSKSKLSVSSSPLWSLSSTSVVCCTMRNKLGCLALRLKLVNANIEASWPGVAPIFMADGGRVPCAGDSEPSDENVRSPKPLLSLSGAGLSCTSSAGVCAGSAVSSEGDACLSDVRVLLIARDLLDEVDAGV
jgi:hypothetical protein